MSHERRLKSREQPAFGESESGTAGNAEDDARQVSQGAGGRPKSTASPLRATFKPGKSVQVPKGSRTTKSSGKDRHSKVNTARGPRDRRVRLSVSTAIQFYDIQDRLGFDQPSKAIEWLLRKAKPAIDELNQQHQQQQQQQQGEGSPVGVGGAQGGGALPEAAEQNKDTDNLEEPPNPGVWKLHEAAASSFASGVTGTGLESRKRDKVHEKDTTSGASKSTTPSPGPVYPPPPPQQQPGFPGSSLFENLYTGTGGMRSSFTQLLQTPIPAAVLQGSSHHNLLQNPQFLQGLYNTSSSSSQQPGSLQLYAGSPQEQQHYVVQQQQQQRIQQQEVDHGFMSPGIRNSFGSSTIPPIQMNAAAAAAAATAAGMSQRYPFHPSLQLQHHHHHFQHLFNLESNNPPVVFRHASDEEQHQHFQHQARQYQPQDFFVPRPPPPPDDALYRRIPARIQGMDDMDVQNVQNDGGSSS